MSDPADDKTQPRVDRYVGRIIGERFKVIQLVGTGGMGRVYRAMQKDLDRPVALKILDPPHAGLSDSMYKRFSAEAAMTASLHHPNTVTVIEHGKFEGTLYIAFEFLEGRTLSQVLASNGALPWPRVLYIAQQVARSLRQAHSMGVVHRDLKPANIMLLDADSDTDLVKVLDFGLVKAFTNQYNPKLEQDVTQAGMLVGSPTYMSPEQGQSSQADPRSDLYALGIVMYECLTGSPPFHGNTPVEVILKHINLPPPPIRVPLDFPLLPAAVETLVMRCLAKEPENRPASMDEFLLATQALLVSSGASSSVPALSSPDGQHASSPPYFISSPPHFARNASSSPHFVSHTSAPVPLTQVSPVYTLTSSAPAEALSAQQGPRSTLAFVSPGTSAPPPQAQSTRSIWLGALVLGLLCVGLVWTLFQNPVTSPPPSNAQPPLAPAPPLIQKFNAPEELFGHDVSSSPPGATVFLNGVRQGLAPLTLHLPMSQDNHPAVLRLELDGYQTLEFETLLGPHLSPVHKQLHRLPPGSKPSAAVPTPMENIQGINLEEEEEEE